ncbi:MAG TPA: response regulator [Polyangiaceae bacterium]|nr:response regulator [Polyangiaceae bacterium]
MASAVQRRMHEDEARPACVAPLWQPSEPARIIVTQDDPELRELVMTKLLDDGHEVYGASSARELLHLLAAAGSTIPPLDGADLIVLDQDLRDLSGIEIIRRLRGARSKIPLLLMAGFPSRELLRETKTLRVPILVKPFPLSDLSNAALLLMLMSTTGASDLRKSATL